MKNALLLFVAFLSFAASAQKGIWQKVDKQTVAGLEKKRSTSYSENEQYFQLNVAALKTSLANVTDRLSGQKGIVISIPNAAGETEQFAVWEKSNFEPELQAQFPEIRSYIGKGITDRKATLFFSLSPKGIETMILRADSGSEFIEPYTKDNSVYVLFDSKTRTKSNLPFVCKTQDLSVNKQLNEETNTAARASNGVFKTMRLALSCTSEYTTYHGGTTALALAAMNATMTRVNGVYNIDLALQLNLIANESAIIYNNAATDPYSDASSMDNWNDELQANLTATIGSANYDIGHLFGASGGGGNAGCIGCVCSTGKGSGITSPGDGIPEGDTYDIDYVAHEMGHQLGGTHSYSIIHEGSGTNVEPGSGSTIMGYAGITGSTTDVQAHSNDYFVYANVIQIQQNLATKSCPVSTPLSNSAPVVDAGQEYTIPKSTPFVLTGSATDADGDELTYTWEQNDDSTSAYEDNLSIASATKTAGPNFRSFTPTALPLRYFPAMNRILTNQFATSFEALPSITRDLNFVLTARDANITGGQTGTDGTTIHVTAAAGPFAVTAPNAAASLAAGTNQTVTWNVAGTTANGINTPYVDIYMSTSNSSGFVTLLASAVPNDGSEVITVPNTTGSTNRIMVRGHNNVFFDISNANFTIAAATSTQAIAFSGVAGEQNKSVCSENSVSYTFNYVALAGFNDTTTFSAAGNPAGTTVSFSPASTAVSGPVVMTVTNLSAATAGFYTIATTSTSGAVTKTANFYLQLGFTAMNLVSPANLATGQTSTVQLTWDVNPSATSFDLQVATDVNFNNIILSTNTTATSYSVSGLSGLTDYYWRVAPKSESCTGLFSTPFKFTTANCGSAVASTNLPLTIPLTANATVNATLVIPAANNVTINDINVTLNISHTWIHDLTVTLISPTGTLVKLFQAQCDDEIPNAVATFDDSGIALVCGSNPGVGGTVIPLQPLSNFNGQNTQGTWTLRIKDSAQGDGGALNSWSLNICGESTLGVIEQEFSSLTVYPNPSNGSFNVQMDKLMSDKVNVDVYDMQGRSIFTKKYNTSGTFDENIQLNNVQAGVYLLSLTDGERKEVKRIIVQ